MKIGTVRTLFSSNLTKKNMGIGIKTISGTDPKKLTAPGSSAEYIQNKNIGNLTLNFMVFVLENQYTWHWGYNLEQFAEVMEYMITSAVRPCQDSSPSVAKLHFLTKL